MLHSIEGSQFKNPPFIEAQCYPRPDLPLSEEHNPTALATHDGWGFLPECCRRVPTHFVCGDRHDFVWVKCGIRNKHLTPLKPREIRNWDAVPCKRFSFIRSTNSGSRAYGAKFFVIFSVDWLTVIAVTHEKPRSCAEAVRLVLCQPSVAVKL